MKQLIQNLNSGMSSLIETPCPSVKNGFLLIKTKVTLVSNGTERMLIEFSNSNLINKALQQPDKVRMTIDKLKSDGFLATYDAVKSKLDVPIPLGYSNVGEVVDIGEGVTGFAIGDRVVSNGHHSEFVCVSKNLCAKIPTNVSDEEAVFVILGSIALNGIRLLNPTLGEVFVVIGLGLIGQIALQILKANGCIVIGADINQKNIELAKKEGINVINLSEDSDPINTISRLSRGKGVDGVLITTATESDLPIHYAAEMCRKRGRIVLVGTAGMKLNREDFFKKEITFQVSASYGPGRYDINYEEYGNDYPIGYVRWTEQRNFEAILDLIENKRIKLSHIISHRYKFENIINALDLLLQKNTQVLGIIIDYENNYYGDQRDKYVTIDSTKNISIISEKKKLVGCFIGSGSYSKNILLPVFKKNKAQFSKILSNDGVSSNYLANKYSIPFITSDADQFFKNNSNDYVVIANRHDSHAKYIIRCLKERKNIYVEKPLCIKLTELDEIKDTYLKIKNNDKPPLLMIGFNRRFSPYVTKLKELLKNDNNSKLIILKINAGSMPLDHWTLNKNIGGGRLIGEVCHFVDLLRFIAESKITSWYIKSTKNISDDGYTIIINFENNSEGVIHYITNGSKNYPKETLEVFSNGKILHLNNYRSMKGYNFSNFKSYSTFRQEKGHVQCVKAFLQSINNGLISPIPIDQIFEVSKVVIEMSNEI